MFYNDHPPPHFHVRYGGSRAVIGIEDLALLEGDLSPRVLGLVITVALEPSGAFGVAMLKDVVSVIASDPYRLQIRFEDGVEGSVALDELIAFDGVFAPLRDTAEFRKVSVHPELGVV